MQAEPAEARPAAAGRAARRNAAALPVLIWLILGLIFVGLHYQFYFRSSWFEGGDFAANAFQILNAKSFSEIYGNYSRFGFNHPGPAFFYVYALGEAILFDGLKLVPAPHNAHALSGLLLQITFFVWAICIAARRINRPMFLPLALLFGAIHFGTVNHFLENTAFQSIWAPHVLLMPFLCLLIAGASVASGGTRHLVPLVLAGCFLVHGHVAQPLFVVPLVALAYAMWWQTERRGGRSARTILRAAAIPHVIAAVAIALFLLPLVVDVAKGKDSNLHAILEHLRTHTSDRKTLAQSALYLVSFLCHEVDPQNFCDTLNSASFAFLRPRWYLLAMWALIATSAAALARGLRNRGSVATRAFARWLGLYFLAAVLLTLLWGMLQSGPMYGFNGHFNFAILFIPFLLLAFAIASHPRLGTSKLAAGGIYGLALPLFFFASRNFSFAPDFPTLPRGTAELQAQIERAAAADRHPSRTKLLLFDLGDWPEAARVALALERLGYEPRVQKERIVFFGRKRGVELAQAAAKRKFAVWRVRMASAGPEWLSSAPGAVDPDGGEISFSADSSAARDFILFGWTEHDREASRTTGETAVVRFTPKPAAGDVQIVCDIEPVTEPQPMTLTFNEKVAATVHLTARSDVALQVPAAVWNDRRGAILQLASTNGTDLNCIVRRVRFRTAP